MFPLCINHFDQMVIDLHIMQKISEGRLSHTPEELSKAFPFSSNLRPIETPTFARFRMRMENK